MPEIIPTCPVDGSLVPPDCHLDDIYSLVNGVGSVLTSVNTAVLSVLSALAVVYIVFRSGNWLLSVIQGRELQNEIDPADDPTDYRYRGPDEKQDWMIDPGSDFDIDRKHKEKYY